jgi:DNA-directed RNA polymerase subunit RPC12/RpoP
MTTIKCKKCGTDLEIPYDSSKCKNCGKDLIASVNHSIKTTEAETKNLMASKEKIVAMALEIKNISIEKVDKINADAEKDMKKIAEDSISEIEACGSTSTKAELDAITTKYTEAQKAVFDKALRNSKMVVENHKKEIEWLSEKTGFEITEDLLDKIDATTHNKQPKLKAEKLVSLSVDAVDYIIFFLVTPLGMATVEDYFLGGAILIIGGFMALPPLRNKILKSFSWISLASFWLLMLVVIMAGLFKLILSMGAGA